MKTLQYHKNLPKLVTFNFYGISLSASRKLQNITNYHLHRISNILSVQRNLTNSVAIPIDEATEK